MVTQFLALSVDARLEVLGLHRRPMIDSICLVSGDIPDVMRIIVSQERKFVTSNKVEAEGMKPTTRKILQELYGKFNEELAKLLNDDRYTWEYTYTK